MNTLMQISRNSRLGKAIGTFRTQADLSKGKEINCWWNIMRNLCHFEVKLIEIFTAEAEDSMFSWSFSTTKMERVCKSLNHLWKSPSWTLHITNHCANWFATTKDFAISPCQSKLRTEKSILFGKILEATYKNARLANKIARTRKILAGHKSCSV